MVFCSSNKDSHFDDLGEHADKDERTESGEGMPHAARIAGIGELLKTLRKDGECRDGFLRMHIILP